MSKWQKVYGSENEIRAKIVKDKLMDSGLNPVILKKKDSSLNNFGGFEVVVIQDDIIVALKIIQDEIDFE